MDLSFRKLMHGRQWSRVGERIAIMRSLRRMSSFRAVPQSIIKHYIKLSATTWKILNYPCMNSPYYWALILYYGEPESMSLKTTNPNRWYLVGAALLLFLLLGYFWKF